MNILVLSDDLDVLNRVTAVARNTAGVTVHGCIPLCSDHGTHVTVSGVNMLIVNVTATGMRGLDTVYGLRTRLPDIGIIAVSSVGHESLARSLCECGADLFIPLDTLERHLLRGLRSLSERYGTCTGVSHQRTVHTQERNQSHA